MYPFSAIVGQERLKQALLLCAVNPGIGGVLIKGEKGTAKSTAARGLSAVMPVIERIRDSFFNISVNEFLANNPAGADGIETEKIPVPFVDLPLGASEDRVLGSLDLEVIISEKKRKLQPGLLAAAHRGILYIDEVNLLPDHLVDILLDVAASGVNTIQREGLSASHPSRFVLIGTMNPEEGNLRPQFLDRFGLMVEVGAQDDVKERTEVVRRRMAFELDPKGFREKWRESQEALTSKIYHAQQLLPLVEMPDGLLTMISQLCIEWSVASLRADIVMYKTAVTLAALAARKTVTAEDIKQAAQLVLIHRKSQKTAGPGVNPGAMDGLGANPRIYPGGAGGGGAMDGVGADPRINPGDAGDAEAAFDAAGHRPDADDDCGDGSCLPGKEDPVMGAAVRNLVDGLPANSSVAVPDLTNGRRSKAVNTQKGFQIRAEKHVSAKDIAITETLTHAILRNPDKIEVRKEDLHQKVRRGKTGHLILFVVDASGSMAAGKRMEAVKGSVLSLLKDAYQKRDMVGVVSFRGVEAEILLEPTSSIDLAESAMEKLPTGGRTPLAHAMQLAQQILTQYKNQQHLQPLLIVLSDGKANVPLAGGGDAWQQALVPAAGIAELGVQSLVLDTEKGYLRFGRAAELARALGGECLSLDELSSEGITDTVSTRISS